MKDDFSIKWYEQWMKQSQAFFEAANSHLTKDFFKSDAATQLKDLEKWAKSLKEQWSFAQFQPEHKANPFYLQWMQNLMNEAFSVLSKQWQTRSENNDAVKSLKELYSLWLNCCHEVYQQTLQTEAYQEAYGEFLNAALKYWSDIMATH